VLRYGIVQSTGIESLHPACRAEPDFVSRIVWFENLASLAEASPTGVFFSNELVDAFPVHVIVHRSGQWLERHVALDGDNFRWTERPSDNAALAQAVRTLPLPAIEGYVTEINLRARDWIAEAGRAMSRGYVVTIDYGYPEAIYYAPFRTSGTLQAFAKHRVVPEVLAEPGARDITAQVDFTALAQAGRSAGLATAGFLDQQRFLMGIAHDELSGAAGPRMGIAENLRAWNTLTHPEFLGSRFRALVQVKHASGELDALRFSRGDL
jgi:SAM-dependent MidA family methyltransferase